MNIELKCRARPVTQDGEDKIGFNVISWCVTKKELTSPEQFTMFRHRHPKKVVTIVIPCSNDILNACSSMGNDMIIITQPEIKTSVGDFVNTAIVNLSELVDLGMQTLYPHNLSRGTASSRGLFI